MNDDEYKAASVRASILWAKIRAADRAMNELKAERDIIWSTMEREIARRLDATPPLPLPE